MGDAQAEAGEEGGQDAAADEGHDDEEEDLPGVALGPAGEVAEEALELLVGALEEAVAGGALVVGRFAWDLLGGRDTEEIREGRRRSGALKPKKLPRLRLRSSPRPKNEAREELCL